MEPTRQEKRPRNAGRDPISMKTNQWYSEPNDESNDSQTSSFKHMNEDSFGIKRSPYQIPRPVTKDKGRLARKRGDVPPPLPDGALFEHRQDTSSYF